MTRRSPSKLAVVCAWLAFFCLIPAALLAITVEVASMGLTWLVDLALRSLRKTQPGP
jgi:hypothetical protein